MPSWSKTKQSANKKIKPQADPATYDVVSQYLDHVMKNTVEQSVKEPEWRVSKFPMCGLLETHTYLTGQNTKIPFSMDFFTKIGTAVHETLQFHAVNHPRLQNLALGYWECASCKKQHDPTNTQPHRRPEKCTYCDSKFFNYKEIAFSHRGISGHLDLLVQTKKRRIAFEFKTTSGFNIENPHVFLPYSKHFFQIETYCWLLDKIYNLRPTHYAIVYVGRDAAFSEKTVRKVYLPFIYPVTDEMLEARQLQFIKTVKQKKAVNTLLQNPSRENVQAVVDIKPCKDSTQYKAVMKHSFFSTEDCPFAKDHSCFKRSFPRPAQEILNMLNNFGN